MNDEQIEIYTKSKDKRYIKEMIFSMYPQYKPYTNNCFLEREFGESEVCGINKLIIILSPNKSVEFTIVYSE